MHATGTFTLTRTNLITLIILLGVATAAPLIGNQFITGTIVNASLLISVSMLGIGGGLLIAIVPSTIALATGLLPVVLAPMIPFIILGNALLVSAFAYLGNKNYWLGVVTGSLLKFIFLTGITTIVLDIIIHKSIASNLAYMLSWPQLVTALAGSFLAYGFLSLTHKTKVRRI
jgi:hypothetical protein